MIHLDAFFAQMRYPKFRIVRVSFKNDPCHWQLQERQLMFWWKDAGGNVSSATTAAHEMERLMGIYS
jgi:hypothetical protein